MVMRRQILLAVATLPLLLPAPAQADEVADALAEATRAYQAGQVATARTAMEEALQLLAQRTAAELSTALPSALPGWQAEKAESQTAALGLLGGGSQASRRYKNATGQYVEIQVTADSPLLAQLGMVMANPAIAGAMGKLIHIGSQRAIQNNNNEIQMMVDNRILVMVNGNASTEDKLAYAQAIDLTKLSSSQ
jgi:hypothetical protein